MEQWENKRSPSICQGHDITPPLDWCFQASSLSRLASWVSIHILHEPSVVVVEQGINEVVAGIGWTPRTEVFVVWWDNATQVDVAQVVGGRALGSWVVVVAIGTEVVMECELIAVAWLVLIVVPGAWEPVDLAHGRKSHGLFHGQWVVMVEPRVTGVWSGYHGVPIEVWVHSRVGLCSTEVLTDQPQSAFQVEGVIIQLSAMVSK